MYCATVKFVFWSPRCKARPSTAYCLITNNQVLFGSMAACYETAWSMALSTGRQTNVYIVCYIGIRVSFFSNFIEYRRFNHFQILYLVFQTISSIFFSYMKTYAWKKSCYNQHNESWDPPRIFVRVFTPYREIENLIQDKIHLR